MPYNLINRIDTLRKIDRNISCAAVVRELRHRGIKLNTSEFSRWANGVENPPRSDIALEAADKIVTEWEVSHAERIGA